MPKFCEQVSSARHKARNEAALREVQRAAACYPVFIFEPDGRGCHILRTRDCRQFPEPIFVLRPLLQLRHLFFSKQHTSDGRDCKLGQQ
jgi:hypothetical protein